MGVFDSIRNAIFGHNATPTAGTTAGAAAPATTPPPTPVAQVTAAPSLQTPAQPPLPQPVDVAAILNGLAAKSPQKLAWQSSIVDLLKLLGLDSSLQNRTTLAQELGYRDNTADSASMNIWLHQQVMNRLAESGGKVPASLRG